MTLAEAWPKTCGCGETWAASEWRELPLVGHYRAGREGWIELRTCVCGATMTIEAAQPSPPAPAADPVADNA